MVRKKEFERFYQDNIDKIYRFVFFRVNKDKELAEDLVSEIFIKALEHFESYDKKKSESAWLYAIAKNHIANYWRDKKDMESLPELDVSDDEEGVGLEDKWFATAMQKFSQTSDRRLVYELISKLDAGEQKIVTFHYLFGYNYCEIGQMLGKSETAVKVMAHRALKKLQKIC
jgi:RNA polymerase sigma-70 factor (ECF subfamily)